MKKLFILLTSVIISSVNANEVGLVEIRSLDTHQFICVEKESGKQYFATVTTGNQVVTGLFNTNYDSMGSITLYDDTDKIVYKSPIDITGYSGVTRAGTMTSIQGNNESLDFFKYNTDTYSYSYPYKITSSKGLKLGQYPELDCQ